LDLRIWFVHEADPERQPRAQLHIPEFLQSADRLTAAGYCHLVCIAANDPLVDYRHGLARKGFSDPADKRLAQTGKLNRFHPGLPMLARKSDMAYYSRP